MAKKKKKRVEKVGTASYKEFFERRLVDMNKVIDLDYSKHDYHNTIKVMIKKSMQKREEYEIHGKISDTDAAEFFKTTPVYQKRRTEALMEYLPLLSKKFKASYPDIPLERIVLDMNKCPTAALPDSMFVHDGQTTSRSLTVAIALYILDELYRNNTIWEALLYLPTDKDCIETIYLPDDDFTDAVFPNEVIKSMTYLIENRDGEDNVFLNTTSARRTKETVLPIEHTNAQITREQYQSGDCDEIKAIRERVTVMSYRERMDKILSLMSPVIVERATTRFENKLFNLFDTTFSICRKPMNEIKNSVNTIIGVLQNLLKLEKRMDNMGDQIDVTPLIHITKPNCLIKQNPINIQGGLIDGLIEKCGFDANDKDTIWKIGNDWINQQAELQNEQKHAEEVTRRYYDYIYLIENGHNHEFQYENNIDIVEPMSKLTIENPYELLFAYFYLLDRGSNIVWLVEPAATIVDMATCQLPWMSMKSRKLQKIIENTLDNSNEIDIVPDKDYIEKETKLYQPNYTDFIDWYMCGMKQIDSDDLRKLNFTQIIYQLSNVNIPRNMSIFDDELYHSFARTGISKRNIPLTRLFIETSNLLTMRNRFHLFTEHVNEQLDADKLQAEITEKASQITQLKTALYNAERKAREEQTKAEKLAENAALEHEELIELRELIYKIQNDTDDNSTTPDEDPVTLPYTPKQNVVIFGGHETWLKAIRPLLPKVRFIDPHTNPDINMIQNADVVWMQSNAMPHSYYNKIMNIARQRRIPVKYFAYASAEKCARQLANDDMSLNTVKL